MSERGTAPAVLVTRAEPGASELADALRAHGLSAVILPTIATVINDDTTALDRAITDLGSYDWLVFSSATAVRIVLARMNRLGIPLGRLGKPEILCGPSTAMRLREVGLRPTVLEPRFSAAGAARYLLEQGVRGKRVLLPVAENGRKELAGSLREAGAIVHTIGLYSTVSDVSHGAAILDLIQSGGVQTITLASPSAVRGLMDAVEHAGEPNPARTISTVPVFCLGATTSDQATRLGITVQGISNGTSVESLAAAVSRSFDSVGAGR